MSETGWIDHLDGDEQRRWRRSPGRGEARQAAQRRWNRNQGWSSFSRLCGKALLKAEIANGILGIGNVAAELLDQRSWPPASLRAIDREEAQVQPILLEGTPAKAVLPV